MSTLLLSGLKDSLLFVSGLSCLDLSQSSILSVSPDGDSKYLPRLSRLPPSG